MGALWLIGDGRSIDIWDDAWIPGCRGGRLHEIVGCDEFITGQVEQLIDRGRHVWKIENLEFCVPEEDCTAIEQIPILPSCIPNRLIRPFEKFGNFSVSTCLWFYQK